MKIIVEKFQFLKALKFVSQIIPKNPTISCLSCFLIKTVTNSISISGTDFGILSTMSLKCKVEEAGEMVINAKQLLGIVHGIRSYNITIITKEENIIINPGKSETKIVGMSVSDFPELNESIKSDMISFLNIDLTNMIEKTSFSVSQDKIRLELTGVYWKITSNKMIMVATDGHRLSFYEKQITIKIKESIEIIIPIKTINYILYLLKNGIKLKGISCDNVRICFDFDKLKVISKLVEGSYPNYEQVIPKYNSKKVHVQTKEFIDAIQKVMPLSNTITHLIQLTISPNKMELVAKNEDIGGESRETIAIRYDGEQLTSGYNAAFLSEILRKIETEEVVLELETPTTACIIKPVFKSKGILFEMNGLEEYLYLIMPLRLHD